MDALPDWIKAHSPDNKDLHQRVNHTVNRLGLHTVCEEASCPNRGECWGQGTATFLLLGEVCTRNCRFCHVETGNPKREIDHSEPQKISRATEVLELDYIVLTSVDRDDLPRGGARVFARTVTQIQAQHKDTRVEVLIPDFQLDPNSLRLIAQSSPAVIGHNIETVERLTPKVRDSRASYLQSLRVLNRFSNYITKSSVMVGLGETKPELKETLKDLRETNVDIVTIGQYLRPTHNQIPVDKFWKPEQFTEIREWALDLGFSAALAGPFVRSSYKAKQVFSTLSSSSKPPTNKEGATL